MKGSRLRAQWKQILRDAAKPPRDPSLRDQLSARMNEKGIVADIGSKTQWYMNAVQKGDKASRDTKRKWRRTLGL